MAKLLRVLSIGLLACLAFLVFVLGHVPLVEGRHLLDPYIDTQFAKDYTPEKFDQIRLGMTIEAATQRIGEPLSKGPGQTDTLVTQYTYTNDGKHKRDGGNGDFAWYRSALVVDSTHTIIQIDRGWSYD